MPVSEIAAALRTTAKRYSHGGPCWCLDGWRPEHGYDHEHDVVCHQAREAISALTALEAGAVLPTQQNQQEPLGDDGCPEPQAPSVPVSESPLSTPWRETTHDLEGIVRLARVIVGTYYEFTGEGDHTLASCLTEYIDALDSLIERLDARAEIRGPSEGWLRHMADAEDAAGSVSVGGLAADLGLYQQRSVAAAVSVCAGGDPCPHRQALVNFQAWVARVAGIMITTGSVFDGLERALREADAALPLPLDRLDEKERTQVERARDYLALWHKGSFEVARERALLTILDRLAPPPTPTKC